MDGPFHYGEAERLIASITNADGAIRNDEPGPIGAAQVHAGLATAAAMLVSGPSVPADSAAWQAAFAGRPS